ncbi:MAG: VCBS repeat-containing protein, partial [Deltaproteobacteria bacterium]|nr:VCBS repeat-containing protein [Deltaproteobacteria bacterium]
TTGCVTFDATGTTGAPAADLASGLWFWGLRGLIGGVAGGPVGPVWRLRIASATVAGARPWGGDPDVNGDGYSDVLAAVANIGASIYVGGPTGPTATPVTVAAPLDSTHFGQAIDFAGDVNGDGYGDLVVGAPGSNGVYVYRGAATGVDPTPGLVTGPAGSGLGSAVAGAGDVNGDGFDDVVAVNPSGNAVWLVPGGVGGLGTAVRVNVPLTSTASVLAGAGDVDGDGYADVLLAGGGGSGQLLRGGVSGLDGASSVAVDRTSGAAGDLNGDGRGDLAFVSGTTARVVLGAGTIDPAGSSVAGVLAAESRVSARGGDYNGDGFDDLVVAGNITHNSVPVARTIVAPGGAFGPGAAVPLVSGFGSATVRGPVGAGDVDGDGVDDLLSRQPGSTDLYLTRGSRAGLVFGRLAYLDLSDNTFYGYYTSWSPVGDVDRDGYDDFAIGQTIYRGTATGLSATGRWTLPYERNNYVAGVGDLNNDGYMDVGVATLGSGAPGFAWLRVSLGSATGPGATVYTVADAFLETGEAIVSYQGFCGAGDLDGDGFDDLLVGQHTDLVYFGRAPFTTPLRAIRSSGSGYFYVGEAGDTNHDGFADVVLRARSHLPDSVVVAGAATGLGATLAVLPSNALPVAIGDVNGDAFADLAVSTAAGIGIHLGSSAGPARSAALTLPAGTPLAVGDVNRDGRPDLVVTRTDRVRRADLYLGTGTGFAPTPSLTWPDFAVGIRTRGAAGFGDIDGDGFDDVVMFHDRGVAVQRFDVPSARPTVLTLTGSGGSAVTVYR